MTTPSMIQTRGNGTDGDRVEPCHQGNGDRLEPEPGGKIVLQLLVYAGDFDGTGQTCKCP